jgi:hypothetical protein
MSIRAAVGECDGEAQDEPEQQQRAVEAARTRGSGKDAIDARRSHPQACEQRVRSAGEEPLRIAVERCRRITHRRQ